MITKTEIHDVHNNDGTCIAYGTANDVGILPLIVFILNAINHSKEHDV